MAEVKFNTQVNNSPVRASPREQRASKMAQKINSMRLKQFNTEKRGHEGAAKSALKEAGVISVAGSKMSHVSQMPSQAPSIYGKINSFSKAAKPVNLNSLFESGDKKSSAIISAEKELIRE